MNVPIGPGPIQGKNWGTTQLLFEYNCVEVHRIVSWAKGFCSEHYHDFKFNRFVVFSGQIRVTIFDDIPEHILNKSDPIKKNRQKAIKQGVVTDVTTLSAGMATDVPPRKWHMFEALKKSSALEFYWVQLDRNDIIRRTVGGMRNASEK